MELTFEQKLSIVLKFGVLAFREDYYIFEPLDFYIKWFEKKDFGFALFDGEITMLINNVFNIVIK